MALLDPPRASTLFPRSLRGVLLLLPLLVLPGCGGADEPVDPGGPVLPPLEVSTWFLHEAQGNPVPTFVVGAAGLAGESTRADSARLEILSGGRVEYRSWMERRESTGGARYVATVAQGSWSAGSKEYTVVLGVSGRTLTLRPSPQVGLEGIQELSPELGGASIQVLYRTIRPPPPGG